MQKVLNEINNTVKENNVYAIDSKTKMDQQFKSEGQCQGQKISIYVIVEKHGFSAIILNQVLVSIAEDYEKIKKNMDIVNNVSIIDSKTKMDR